jgi:hypothetical protein
MPRTESHAIPSGIQAIGALIGRPQCPPAFRSFCSSFLSLCLSPAFRKEISRLDRLDATIANSVDPLHPRFCLSSCAFPFPKVDRCRHLIVSTGILPFSDLRCTAFAAVSSASFHRQRFRSESRLADQDSQGYEFCACGTGMTDVFTYFPGRSLKKTDSDDRRQGSVQLTHGELLRRRIIPVAYRSVAAIRVSNSSNTWDGERSVTPSADET